MWKKIFLITSLCFLFILTLITINSYTLEVSNFANYMSTFDDNYIIATISPYINVDTYVTSSSNQAVVFTYATPIDEEETTKGSFAYTLEDQKEIENMEHVKNATFTDSYMLESGLGELNRIEPPSEYLGFDQYLYFEGNYSTIYNRLDKNLDYIYGHELTTADGIVISDQTASILLKYNIFDVSSKEELIGQTFNNSGYEIEGIYKNPFTTLPDINWNNYDHYEQDITYYNSYIQYMQQSQLSDYGYTYSENEIKNEINYWNQDQAYIPANQDKIQWTQSIDDDGYYQNYVDYNKSVELGAINLINPQDFNNYDNHLYDTVIVEVDDAQNKESVINNLNEINNMQNVITSDTKMSDLTNYPNNIIYIIFSFIILFILLYYRYFNWNLKKSFISLLIYSIISISIATLVCFLLPIHVFISNSIIIFSLAFVCLCFITMIKYSVIKINSKI